MTNQLKSLIYYREEEDKRVYNPKYFGRYSENFFENLSKEKLQTTSRKFNKEIKIVYSIHYCTLKYRMKF